MNASPPNSGFSDHFSTVASRYAEFRPHYPQALFDYLASLVPADSTVWDCACGAGQASVDLAGRFKHVIATDGSKEQVASAPRHPRIEYRVAVAEESGLPARSIGLVTVAQALHWFDFDRFYQEVNRVLVPGGVIAVWSYGVHETEGSEVHQIVQDYYSNVVGPFWPPERRLVEEGYRTIPFPFDEMAAPRFHMETQWSLAELLGYLSTWSATNRYAKQTGKNPIEPLAMELAKHWQNGANRRIVWPLTVRIGKKPCD
jgi:ubiquinone/menaquinone biosynthesis C-methylase UbiE